MVVEFRFSTLRIRLSRLQNSRHSLFTRYLVYFGSSVELFFSPSSAFGISSSEKPGCKNGIKAVSTRCKVDVTRKFSLKFPNSKTLWYSDVLTHDHCTKDFSKISVSLPILDVFSILHQNCSSSRAIMNRCLPIATKDTFLYAHVQGQLRSKIVFSPESVDSPQPALAA